MISKKDFEPIIKYLRPYKKIIATAAVFTVFENVSQLITPVIYGSAIDIVVKQQAIGRQIFILLAAWIVIVFLGDWFGRMKSRRSAEIAFKASQNIIVQPISHLLKLPLSFHKSKKIGEIIQRFTRADNYMYQLVENGIFEITPNILTAVFAFIIIAWIQWQMAAIYIAFIILYFVLTIIMTNPIIEQQKKLNKIFERAYGDIF